MPRTEVRTIPYAPRRAFLPFHRRGERFAVGVAHRRCGKTVACINDLVRRALRLSRDYPPGRFGYIGPYLSQSKDNVWTYLKHYAGPAIRDKNEGELWVELVNGARVRLYGADNPDRIRGAYFDHVVLDEYADMDPNVWGTIVRPMLADYRGGATFIGTPKGRNAFFELYDRAHGDADWFAFHLPASSTGILPQDELDAAKRDMTPEEYDQEFECSFEAAIKGAYYGREIAAAEREGRICDLPCVDTLPVHTAWDLGKGQNMAIWVWQAANGEIRVVDYLSDPRLNLETYVAELAVRGWSGGIDWVPHDARVQSLETGRTRVETLKAMGRRPRVVPAHKVDDGINSARVLFPRIWFDADRCRDGIEALRQYRAEYDEKAKVFRTTPRHDWASHPADAFRYLCMGYREDVLAAQPAKPKPLARPLQHMTMDEIMAMQNTGLRERA